MTRWQGDTMARWPDRSNLITKVQAAEFLEPRAFRPFTFYLPCPKLLRTQTETVSQDPRAPHSVRLSAVARTTPWKPLVLLHLHRRLTTARITWTPWPTPSPSSDRTSLSRKCSETSPSSSSRPLRRSAPNSGYGTRPVPP